MNYQKPTALFALPLALAPVTGFAQNASPGATQVQVWLTPGYGQGELSWNIAHPTGSPDVLSQLDYEDLELVTGELGVRLEYEHTPQTRLILESSIQFGSIRQGDAQDRDWLGDHRTDLVSLSTARVDGDHVGRLSLAFGYQVPITQWLSLSPLMGYDYREQKINFIDGTQVVSVPNGDFIPPPPGRFAGLDSHYETEWRSLWFGLEAQLAPLPRHTLKLRAEYHLPKYDAVATWNLRTDFAQPNSFEHETNDGHGYRLQLAYGYELTPRWQLRLHLDWEKFRMEDGIDRLHFVEPQVATAYSPLNEVEWKQWNLSAGLAWHF